MATVRKWSNVAVAMQSALAAAVTVTAITKANPGVATATAHGFANGEYKLLTVNGMYQVDGKVVRVANVTANTFELEGVNTTGYETFSSGTAEAITFGTSITTATSISASGGDFDFIDTTTIHSNVKSQVPGAANSAKYEFENIWDVSDAGLMALNSASDNQAKRAFKFTFGTAGQIMVFAGYVGATLLPTGSAQDKVVTPATITMHGKPTYYAS